MAEPLQNHNHTSKSSPYQNNWLMENHRFNGGHSMAAKAICEHTGIANPITATLKLSNDLVIASGRSYPPYDPESYATMQNAEVKHLDYINYDGRIFPLDKGYIIEICSKRSEERQNFCCCHEVGHTFFLSLSNLLLQKVAHKIDYKIKLLTEVSEEERLCNIAASEMLMPHSMFKEIALSYKPGIRCINLIAKEFRVSFLASIIRILEMGAWKCIAIIWTPVEYKRPESGFRVNWFGISYGWNYFIPIEKVEHEIGSNPLLFHSYQTGKRINADLKNDYIMESTRLILNDDNKCVFSLIYKRCTNIE